MAKYNPGPPRYSPGPWRWKTDGERGAYELAELVDRSGDLVCDFGGGPKWEESNGTPPSDANALLIAAAPEMLELLRGFANWEDGRFLMPRTWEQLDAVLARIELAPNLAPNAPGTTPGTKSEGSDK